MKIAVNTRVLLKNKLEGIGRFTHEVLLRMVEKHPEDEFIFFFDRPFNPEFVYAPNVTPVVLFPPARHPILFFWWFEWSVARALKRFQPDVFLSPDNFLSLRTPVKTVLVVHDIFFVHHPEMFPASQRRYYEFFCPRFLRRADGIVAVSEFVKDDIGRHFPAAAEKIVAACNGCREGYHPLQTAEIQKVREKYAKGQPYFFYVGAVHPRKNVHRLIAAFDQFKQATGAPVKLLIAGRFAWKSGEVKTAWEAARFQKDIIFLGYVSDEEAPALTGAALALTYVSLFEGFGIPILEAMHCDVPVITSNVCSMPEVAGEAGLLVNPLSTEEIAGALHQIWQDPFLRQRLVAEGRKQRTKFSWERAEEVVYSQLQKAITK